MRMPALAKMRPATASAAFRSSAGRPEKSSTWSTIVARSAASAAVAARAVRSVAETARAIVSFRAAFAINRPPVHEGGKPVENLERAEKRPKIEYSERSRHCHRLVVRLARGRRWSPRAADAARPPGAASHRARLHERRARRPQPAGDGA